LNNLEQAKKILLDNDFTCVVIDDNEMRTSTFSGIRPLIQFLEVSEDAFKDASIADRCIGRAAAFLMLHGGVKEIYAKMISDHALVLLEEQGVPVEYDVKVPYIINRTQDDMCPMEKTCLLISDPKEAYIALKAKLKELSKGV